MSASEPFAQVLDRFLSRRGFLKLGAAALAGVAAPSATLHADTRASFEPLQPVPASTPKAGLTVAAGHRPQVLLRWGDRLSDAAPPFDPLRQTAAAQSQQFGYNCDFVGFFPIPNQPDRGLLVVNHEYVNRELMHPGFDPRQPTREQVEIEKQAVGLSVVEIVRGLDGTWEVVVNSPRNRRITATTPMAITGPAAGHSWLAGEALGTMNNCAAGKTPWGTVLSGEENFQDPFANAGKIADERLRSIHVEQYGLSKDEPGYAAAWHRFDERFDASKAPLEPFKFGWVVEVDPFDPASKPKKRTALGRIKHEACTFSQGKNGSPVLYTGDDEKFQCVYKFISSRPYVPGQRDERLLDEGILHVARFNDDGTGVWLPLVHGQGPLTKENGFADQAEVLLETRRAARLVGGTLMDRPEDMETCPATGKVYLALTNNSDRGGKDKPGTDAANPRAKNLFGHLIELTENQGDPAATTFTWSLFLLAGPPEHPTLSCPDNVCFDPAGTLWIATDGAPKSIKFNDGLFAVPTSGPQRGMSRQFLSAPTGAEVCGPEFTPDGGTLFVALQHPGESETAGGSTFEKPISRWPDENPAMPPRPSVVAIRMR